MILEEMGGIRRGEGYNVVRQIVLGAYSTEEAWPVAEEFLSSLKVHPGHILERSRYTLGTPGRGQGHPGYSLGTPCNRHARYTPERSRDTLRASRRGLGSTWVHSAEVKGHAVYMVVHRCRQVHILLFSLTLGCAATGPGGASF